MLEIGGTSAEGASVECHRCEDRGAEGAEGGRVREGGVPGCAMPPPQKNFRFLSSKR